MCDALTVSACAGARAHCLSTAYTCAARFDECVLPVMAAKGREEGRRRPRRDASDQGTTHVYQNATSAQTHKQHREQGGRRESAPTAALSIEVRSAFINNKVWGFSCKDVKITHLHP